MQERGECRRLSGESVGHRRALCPGIFARLSNPVFRRCAEDPAADVPICERALLDRRCTCYRAETGGSCDVTSPFTSDQYAESRAAELRFYLHRRIYRPTRVARDRAVE